MRSGSITGSVHAPHSQEFSLGGLLDEMRVWVLQLGSNIAEEGSTSEANQLRDQIKQVELQSSLRFSREGDMSRDVDCHEVLAIGSVVSSQSLMAQESVL